MDKSFLFIFLIVVTLGVAFTTGTTFDSLFFVISITFLILNYYNIIYLLQNPLFYIFSKNNKYLPPKTIGLLINIFAGIVFSVLFLGISWPLLNFILKIYNYVDLPEFSDWIGYIILAMIAIAIDILFLKILKLLILGPVKKQIQVESDI